MKHFRNIRASGLAILAACIVAAVNGTAIADIIEVPSAAAPSIQAGIELASDGDTVLVSPGTYYEAIDFLGKTIVVESVAGPERTIIDATGLETNAVRVTSGEGMGTTLRGFTITGGVGDDPPYGDAGGGILIHSARMLIDHCIIAENHLDLHGGFSSGGGVAILGSPHVEISNSTIRDNSAALGGGLAIAHSTVTLTDTVFSSNAAMQGGGLNANNGSDVTAINCLFEGNAVDVDLQSAQYGGGAMVLNGTLTLVQCQFVNNSSPIGGGGLNVSSTTFDNNAVVDIQACLFESNSAQAGGGIRLSRGTLLMTDSQVIDNIATSFDGGGIYASSLQNSEISITQTIFSGNQSLEGHGGGASFRSNQLALTVCTFANNVAALNGGGLDVSNSLTGMAAISGTTFMNNTASEYGGGVYADLNNWSTFTNCHFESNLAGQSGGGFSLSEFSLLSVNNSTFHGNSASVQGGAIFDPSNVDALTVSNCELTNNSATQRGGAIATNGRPLIENSALSGNVAGLSGGAIHSNSSPGAYVQAVLACENLPANISGPFTDLGDNQLLEDCPAPQTPGDLNGDGVVDVADLLILLSAWGACVGNCPADLNGDGIVDVADMLILLANWG